jgi:hypothetical protein
VSEQYDSRCLTCGTEVAQITFGSVVKHGGSAAALPRTGGLPRCCRGGTLDRAPMEGYSSVADDGMLDRMIAEGVSPGPPGRRTGPWDGGRGSGAG